MPVPSPVRDGHGRAPAQARDLGRTVRRGCAVMPSACRRESRHLAHPGGCAIRLRRRPEVRPLDSAVPVGETHQAAREFLATGPAPPAQPHRPSPTGPAPPAQPYRPRLAGSPVLIRPEAVPASGRFSVTYPASLFGAGTPCLGVTRGPCEQARKPCVVFATVRNCRPFPLCFSGMLVGCGRVKSAHTSPEEVRLCGFACEDRCPCVLSARAALGSAAGHESPPGIRGADAWVHHAGISVVRETPAVSRLASRVIGRAKR
ncbi:hypothetical protein SAMN04487820_102444 [Actinopolyspora mzabensis]|uniref:Uncharacterized protein n=1 Tax=Actinopolyspora mzabensis TaxID=995066 RepID=A0A1G8X911_ACTMZ|nr:hypothetical protein SAMN04487820_102444 [Actinopolyspora mzabensis]